MDQADWEQTVEWVGIVAGCLVEKDGKYLLVQEMQAKVHGLWNFPAGHVDKGETIEEAAIREVKEETGYIVKLGQEIGLFHESTGSPVKHIFTAKIISGTLTPQEGEILDARWLTFNDIQKLKDGGRLRAPWIWEVIQNSR